MEDRLRVVRYGHRISQAREAADEERRTGRGDVLVKRLYFLAAIAVLQILVGSILLLGAAQPVRLSQDVLVQAGTYYHFEFGILGTGRLSGNLSELQDRSFDLFVFDDAGYASFRDGSNAVAPLLQRPPTTTLSH